jgi:hypothetical protein
MKDVPTWTINGQERGFYRTDYEVGCGGDEVPMEYGRKHYLYVWNKVAQQHEYYCFEDDMFIGETDVPWIVKL